MMAPYLLRLLCLCLATFFVIHCVVGLLIALGGPAAVRAARRMRPRLAGRLLLALRLLPAALALFVVAGLCVPSYLWLEPETNAEEVGAGCLAAAVLAAALWTISTARGLPAAARSARHARDCARLGRLSTLPGSPLPVCILDAPAPLLALVGVFPSRVILSSPLMRVLSAGEHAPPPPPPDAHPPPRAKLKDPPLPP